MRTHGISLVVATLTSMFLPTLGFAQAPVAAKPVPTQPRRDPQPHNVNEIDHKSLTPTYHYSFFPPIPVEPNHPNYYEPAHKSVMRHDPLPPSADRGWGVRNPGGVGRVAEYYPPDNKFQNANAGVPVARFDSGGGPNRAEQQASQALGIARANSIQDNINHYAGGIGYGYGFGFGGGGFPN